MKRSSHEAISERAGDDGNPVWVLMVNGLRRAAVNRVVADGSAPLSGSTYAGM